MRLVSLRQPRTNALVISVLAVLAAIDVQAHGPVALRAPAGVLLVLVFPGWPWLLFVQRRRRMAETVALIVATSMGITIVTGLILNLLPSHLTRSSWSLGLLGATLLGAAVLWLAPDRSGVVRATTAASKSSRSGRGPAGWSTGRRAVLAGGGCMLIALLAVIAIVSFDSQKAEYRQEHFTALSLNATSADVLAVEVLDHEEATVRYRLSAVSEGKQVFTQRVLLRSGQAATVKVRVPSDTVLLDSSLEIRLYRAGRTSPYRSLSLTPREGRWL